MLFPWIGNVSVGVLPAPFYAFPFLSLPLSFSLCLSFSPPLPFSISVELSLSPPFCPPQFCPLSLCLYLSLSHSCPSSDMCLHTSLSFVDLCLYLTLCLSEFLSLLPLPLCLSSSCLHLWPTHQAQTLPRVQRKDRQDSSWQESRTQRALNSDLQICRHLPALLSNPSWAMNALCPRHRWVGSWLMLESQTEDGDRSTVRGKTPAEEAYWQNWRPWGWGGRRFPRTGQFTLHMAFSRQQLEKVKQKGFA